MWSTECHAWTATVFTFGKQADALEKRLTEHKGAVKRCDRKNSIATHAWDQDHRVDWQKASVIQTESHYWKRRVLEAIWIQGNSNTTNLDYMWPHVGSDLVATLWLPQTTAEHLNYSPFTSFCECHALATTHACHLILNSGLICVSVSS